MHFVLLGALLFTLQAGFSRSEATDQTASVDELLFQQALDEGLHHHDPVVRTRLAANMRFAGAVSATSDFELARQAIALGMHESDRVVRRSLTQAVKLRTEQSVRGQPLREADLDRHLQQHRDRFREPARVRIRQQPLDGPLPLPQELPSYSERELAQHFGEAFARAVFATSPHVWSQPLTSVYGRHSVWVHNKTPAVLSRLSAVRSQVREDLLHERGGVALAQEIARLR
jgi:hypothetical protein